MKRYQRTARNANSEVLACKIIIENIRPQNQAICVGQQSPLFSIIKNKGVPNMGKRCFAFDFCKKICVSFEDKWYMAATGKWWRLIEWCGTRWSMKMKCLEKYNIKWECFKKWKSRKKNGEWIIISYFLPTFSLTTTLSVPVDQVKEDKDVEDPKPGNDTQIAPLVACGPSQCLEEVITNRVRAVTTKLRVIRICNVAWSVGQEFLRVLTTSLTRWRVEDEQIPLITMYLISI